MFALLAWMCGCGICQAAHGRAAAGGVSVRVTSRRSADGALPGRGGGRGADGQDVRPLVVRQEIRFPLLRQRFPHLGRSCKQRFYAFIKTCTPAGGILFRERYEFVIRIEILYGSELDVERCTHRSRRTGGLRFEEGRTTLRKVDRLARAAPRLAPRGHRGAPLTARGSSTRDRSFGLGRASEEIQCEFWAIEDRRRECDENDRGRRLKAFFGAQVKRSHVTLATRFGFSGAASIIYSRMTSGG
ncbi:hypothetical protein EVAR_13662_1 [Eumeta japonica]|uniref:Secreted protein n=1 Tax=Eumeta variegata TaxID=151549 RepID=A0A4C1UC52_EUMVA|nr:hypothetical protein EVAR_13662_1 [Eumeta japonica]